jgi:predicted RND superfamily exporter protein
MLLAAHRGLYSFGLVLTIGVASCVFLALIPLPAILTLLDQNRRRRTAVSTFRPKFLSSPVSTTATTSAD